MASNELEKVKQDIISQYADEFDPGGYIIRTVGEGVGEEAIYSDMNLLWSQDKDIATRLTLYIRMITRKTDLIDGTSTETVQRGAGLKHEAIMRMLWIYSQDANKPVFEC